MSYFYGSDSPEIQNPFKKEGLLYSINGLFILIAGIVCLFNLRSQIVANGAAIGWINAIICFLLIGAGLAYLSSGLLKTFRFYVGRGIPGNLAPNAAQNEGISHMGRYVYNSANLEQMLMGRINPTFVEPQTFFDRMVFSFFPKIIFLPYAMRNYVHLLVKKSAYSLIVVTIYMLCLLSGSLGLTHITQSGFSGWIGLLLMAALFFIWVNNKISAKGVLKTKIESLSLGGFAIMTIVAVLIPAIGEIVLRQGGITIPDVPFHPAFYITVTYLLMVLTLVGGVMLALNRANMLNPLTEVSEFRGHWQENVHPKDIFRSFDLEMSDLRYKEIPNRVYREMNPNLNLEGSYDKGSFKGDAIQETQPIPIELKLPDTMVKLRWALAIFGHLLVFIAAVLLLTASFSLPADLTVGYIAKTAYTPLVCWIFGSIAINIAHMYWAEMNFKSFLIHFYGEGTYTESTVSVGMAFTDSTRSENRIVRSSFTPWIIASEITSSTLAGTGSNNLEGARYVMDMKKSDPIMEYLIKGIRSFLDGRKIIADTVSEGDMDAVKNLYAMNQASPAGAVSGISIHTKEAADEEEKKKKLNSGPVPPKEIQG
ncbi:hypothetical protein [Paenibacillus piri]|uniref:Uncharacterized protein n=1 Tax=Paenibacillus piri TaxID=2547395 RepID=A0A4R5KZ58_9BACL|nr:hypothetical protein [Paenibacillus piri]TDG00526.1 hypothetical protein E1757_02520 [Paenibacillus piri]